MWSLALCMDYRPWTLKKAIGEMWLWIIWSFFQALIVESELCFWSIFWILKKKSINVGQIMSFCIFGWNKGISNLQIYPMALCYNCQFQKQEKIFFLNLYNIFAQFEFFVFQLNRWAHSYFLAAAVFCHIVLNSFLFLILANAVQIFCI